MKGQIDEALSIKDDYYCYANANKIVHAYYLLKEYSDVIRLVYTSITTLSIVAKNLPWIDRVAQGSVIGFKLFTLYIGAMSSVLNAHGADGMMHADGILLYVSLN